MKKNLESRSWSVPSFSKTKDTTSIPSAERWEGCYFWEQEKISVTRDWPRDFPHVLRIQESTLCWEPLILVLLPMDCLSRLFILGILLYDLYYACMPVIKRKHLRNGAGSFFLPPSREQIGWGYQQEGKCGPGMGSPEVWIWSDVLWSESWGPVTQK